MAQIHFPNGPLSRFFYDDCTSKQVVKKALIWHIFINKKAFRAGDTTSQQPHKIFVTNAADQIHFVKEMIHPLSCVEEKPFNSNSLPIWQNSLFERKRLTNKFYV